MNLNSIIFPAPTDDKTYELYRYKDEVMFVPKKLKDGSLFHIPCLVQKSKRKYDSNKYLFYFHGNAEDIFNSTGNLEMIRNTLPVNHFYYFLFYSTIQLPLNILVTLYIIKINLQKQ